jgi:phage baseplate assembly protein W
MAVGFSPKLPLQPDPSDGFCRLNKTIGEVIKQNLKMLVLTAPGERIMHPDFGIGARNFLFDTKAEVFQNLKSVINVQIKRFIPFIKIIDISLFDVNLDNTQVHNYLETQYMGLKITYYIPNLNLNDTLKITIANGA